MQPRSNHTIAPHPPDIQARRPTPAPWDRPSVAAPDRSAALTDLSATVSHILGLQQVSAGDAELQNRVRHTVVELELLISYLLRTDGSGSCAPPATPQPTADTTRQRAAEHALLGWLAQPTGADELPLANGDAPEPLARLLGELSLSRRDLPAETAVGLDLPVGTTLGHAATEVLLAVKDPAGPRCRSFRAAVLYLRDLDRDRFTWPDAGQIGGASDGEAGR